MAPLNLDLLMKRNYSKIYHLDNKNVVVIPSYSEIHYHQTAKNNPSREIWVIDKDSDFDVVDEAMGNKINLGVFGIWFIFHSFYFDGIPLSLSSQSLYGKINYYIYREITHFPKDKRGNELKFERDRTLQETLIPEITYIEYKEDTYMGIIYAVNKSKASKAWANFLPSLKNSDFKIDKNYYKVREY